MTRPELDEALGRTIMEEAGLVKRDTSDVTLRPLGGGVSSIVLRAETPAGSFILKQPRPRFTTKAEWLVPTQRIQVEADVNRWLEAGLGPGNAGVPAVRHFDREREVLVTEAAPEQWTQWKARLLEGHVEPERAETAGRLLRRIHSLGADLGDRTTFHNDELFDAQRIDPYWRTAATNVPKAKKELEELQAMFHERHDFVHGDYSPKNLLAGPDPGQLMLVDHEVATRGDAAFDLGFFLTHLVAKSLHVEDRRDAFLEASSTFWAGYGRERLTAADPTREARAIRYLGGIALARARGKSLLEYMEPDRHDALADLALHLLKRTPETWDEVLDAIRDKT